MSDAANPDDELPELDFETFVASMSHSALLHLGDAPTATGELQPDLAMARQLIDILAMLQEKTRGNLSGKEEHMLEQTLYDLRSRYVDVARKR